MGRIGVSKQSKGKRILVSGSSWLFSSVRPLGLNRSISTLTSIKAVQIISRTNYQVPAGRSPLETGNSASPLERLSDGMFRLLVENTRRLREGGGMVVDAVGQVVTE